MEGAYSKSQKDALLHLHRYVQIQDSSEFEQFYAHLELNRAAKNARESLQAESPDLNTARALFQQFGITESAAQNVVLLFRLFGRNYIEKSNLNFWEDSDALVGKLRSIGEQIRALIASDQNEDLIVLLGEAQALNEQLEAIQRAFAEIMAERVREIQRLIIYIITLIAVAVIGVLIWQIGRVLQQLRNNEKNLVVHGENLSNLVIERTLELERRNEEFLQARNAAEAANDAKSNFLAKMSHEIRTPMNAIFGFAHLALEQPLNAEAASYIEKIHLSSRIITSILNDILDISKVEADKLELESIDFDLGELLQTLVSIVEVNAMERNIALKFELSSDVRSGLIGDPHRLGQVLTNLLNNAIKFSPDNSDVQVIVRRMTPRTENAGVETLQFSIIDKGTGISLEAQERLFKPYSQGGKSTAREYGGSGLGLMISKQLVELMGGRIWIEGELQEGTIFHFTVKLQQQVWHSHKKYESEFQEGNLRALVFDALDDSNNNLREMLNLLERPFKSVNSSGRVLQSLDTHVFGKPYDVVFLDWDRYDTDELVRQIRKKYPGSESPVIVLMSRSKPSEIECETLALGIFSVLEKPVDASHLQKVLQEIDSVRYCSGVSAESASTKNVANQSEFVGKRLLLVEDNEINKEIAVTLLAKKRFVIDCAENGLIALERLKSAEYDGILMDCQMPVMDGYEATRKIRKDPKYRSLPILAMTANVTTEDRKKFEANGMNGYIAKPLDLESMFDTLRLWLINSGDEVQKTQGEVNGQMAELWKLLFLDVKKGLTHCSGNESLLRNLLINFRENYKTFDAEFREELTQEDGGNAVLMAHGLKGIANSLGLKELFPLAAKLERSISSGTAESELALERLVSKLEKIIVALNVLK
tara:strand:+ start:151 stop:2784 length:2634 start_codon:yes stop_codon:yes gene_type:complete